MLKNAAKSEGRKCAKNNAAKGGGKGEVTRGSGSKQEVQQAGGSTQQPVPSAMHNE